MTTFNSIMLGGFVILVWVIGLYVAYKVIPIVYFFILKILGDIVSTISNAWKGTPETMVGAATTPETMVGLSDDDKLWAEYEAKHSPRLKGRF